MSSKASIMQNLAMWQIPRKIIEGANGKWDYLLVHQCHWLKWWDPPCSWILGQLGSQKHLLSCAAGYTGVLFFYGQLWSLRRTYLASQDINQWSGQGTYLKGFPWQPRGSSSRGQESTRFIGIPNLKAANNSIHLLSTYSMLATVILTT